MEQSRKQWMDAAKEINRIAAHAIQEMRKTAEKAIEETEQEAVDANKEV